MLLIVYVRRFSALRTLCALFVFCATAVSSQAQTFTTLVSFNDADGDFPQALSLVQGSDGYLYGTTFGGGKLGEGTVFKVSPQGKLITLYNFCGCADGGSPVSGVILSTDGNFYGVAYGNGTTTEGTVFRITPAGSLTTLHTFCSQQDCPDGSRPYGALIQATDGNFYGTTTGGGEHGFGTVFRISSNGTLTTLYSFNGTDGYNPRAGLVESFDGNFFGTTLLGGSSENGNLFKITRNGVFTNLFTFEGTPQSLPFAPLIQAGSNFYGTTSGLIGDGTGTGTIFQMTPDGTVTTLYYFCPQHGCLDGAAPMAPVTLGTDGNLYGTASLGGRPACNESGGCGVIFQLSSRAVFSTIHSFCVQSGCSDGSLPLGGLLQASNGTFYGTTQQGGVGNLGTVFSLDMGLKPFVRFVLPAGRVGQTGGILGQGFTGTTAVTLNGVPALFTVVSDTFIRATVPAGATTGYVTVATPTGTLTSNVPFHVIP